MAWKTVICAMSVQQGAGKMGLDLTIGCVGKPSAGKSTFLNAVTEAKAKTDCPCKRLGMSDKCKPKHGRCEDGKRFVPVKLMDVAGLIPGAAQGKGLGNKFLDDLRHADVFLHILDASGTTNERGEACEGHDPSTDIVWLEEELLEWIYENLRTKWANIVRRHIATKAAALDTLQAQLSGYGARKDTVYVTLTMFEKTHRKEDGHPLPLAEWDSETDLKDFCRCFLEVRFPTIYVLNKCDQPGADRNVMKITKKYGSSKCICTSALAECLLKKCRKAGMIQYTPGNDDFEFCDDGKSIDDKTKNRLEHIRDMVLYRFGTTGVDEAITAAIQLKHPVCVYPVKNLTNYGDNSPDGGAFRDCIIVRQKTTVYEFAGVLSSDLQARYQYAEGEDGRRLGADDEVRNGMIIKIVGDQAHDTAPSGSNNPNSGVKVSTTEEQKERARMRRQEKEEQRHADLKDKKKASAKKGK